MTAVLTLSPEPSSVGDADAGALLCVFPIARNSRSQQNSTLSLGNGWSVDLS